jgi:pilus assembly protein Flp/PilA
MGDTSLSRVSGTARHRVDKSVRTEVTFEGRKENHMIQLLAARIQLAKMRAEEGQALVEYALIVSLIAVVAIAALTLTGTSIRSMLNSIAGSV